MPENPNYQNFSQYRPALKDDGELDDATLDRVVGGLVSPNQAQESQMPNETRSYTAVSNIMKTKHDTVKNSISNIR